MGTIVPEQDYNVINYDKTAEDNNNFYAVVYSNKGQVVLSAIPPGGRSTQRMFKGSDIMFDITSGDGLFSITNPQKGTHVEKVDKNSHVHVDSGESYSIVNVNPDRWLKMHMHFSDRSLPEGAVYPLDPYPSQATMSPPSQPVMISPAPVRTTIQTVPLSTVTTQSVVAAQPYQVNQTQFIPQQVRTVTSPVPYTGGADVPLVIQPTNQMQPQGTPVFGVSYAQPSYVPVTIPQSPPSYPTANITLPKLATQKSLI